MLPEQLHIGIVVHPLRPLGERSIVLALPSSRVMILCARLKARSFWSYALALVVEVVAVPAQEVLPWLVQIATLRPHPTLGQINQGHSSPKLHAVRFEDNGSFTPSHSPPNLLR